MDTLVVLRTRTLRYFVQYLTQWLVLETRVRLGGARRAA